MSWHAPFRQPHVDSHSAHCPITSNTTLGVVLASWYRSRRLVASVGGRLVEENPCSRGWWIRCESTMIRHFHMLPTISFRSCSIDLLYRPLSIFRRSRTAYVGQFVLINLFPDTDVIQNSFHRGQHGTTPHNSTRQVMTAH